MTPLVYAKVLSSAFVYNIDMIAIEITEDAQDMFRLCYGPVLSSRLYNMHSCH